MIQLSLSPLLTPRELANFLGTSYSKLTYVVYGKGTSSLYCDFTIPKKSGGVRNIRAPKHQLKLLQERLQVLLEKLYEPHPAASAFIKDRGILYNAKSHVKKAVVFNIDLEDFYGQINFGRVRGLLMSKPYSLQKDTAQLIAHLCCVDGVLPQGAPTSPIISNMIARRMDKELAYLAKLNKARYTRYADDITFSFHSIGKNSVYKIVCEEPRPHEELVRLIKSNGFSINDSKTRLQNYKERQVVTGLKVNQKINLDRRFIRTTRAMIHSMSIDLDQAHEKYKLKFGCEESKLEYVIHGRINYIGMVKGRNSDVFQSLAKKFNAHSAELTVNTSPEKRDVKLERRLHFSNFSDRERLEKCIWVIDFGGMSELGDGEFVQGSGFMTKSNRLLTASHTFTKAGDPDSCFVYQIKNPSKKFKAKIVSRCKYSDIAELELQSDDLPNFKYLPLAPTLEPKAGYKLSIIGFPELLHGHKSVSILPCTVTNTYVKSSFWHGEVDRIIASGYSGGPVVNAHMQVVGMALQGTYVSYDGSQAHLEGRNAFISAKHFTQDKLDSLKKRGRNNLRNVNYSEVV